MGQLEKEEQFGPHALLGVERYRDIVIEQHGIRTHKSDSGTAQLVSGLLNAHGDLHLDSQKPHIKAKYGSLHL